MLAMLPLTAWAGPFDRTWKSQLGKVQSESKPMEQALEDGSFKCVGCSPNVTIDVKPDGGDQKVAGTNDFARSVKVVCKKDNQVAMEAVDSVSADGKTLTRQVTAPAAPSRSRRSTPTPSRRRSSTPGGRCRSTASPPRAITGTSSAPDAQQNKLTLTMAFVRK